MSNTVVDLQRDVTRCVSSKKNQWSLVLPEFVLHQLFCRALCRATEQSESIMASPCSPPLVDCVGDSALVLPRTLQKDFHRTCSQKAALTIQLQCYADLATSPALRSCRTPLIPSTDRMVALMFNSALATRGRCIHILPWWPWCAGTEMWPTAPLPSIVETSFWPPISVSHPSHTIGLAQRSHAAQLDNCLD